MPVKNLLFILILLFSAPAFSQRVLLQEDVNKDTIPQEVGQNLKKFNHFYIGYGFVAGPSEKSGAEILYPNSTNFIIGYRHKRKISNFYDIGFDLAFNRIAFKLKQDSLKILPNSLIHDREKLAYNQLSLALYNRFNFGRRGNYIATYLDLGAYINWAFSINHSFKEKFDSLNIYGGKQSKVVNKKLEYTDPINYGVLARLGYNRYSVYVNYRLSDLFKEDFPVNYPELPRWTVGFQLGLFK